MKYSLSFRLKSYLKYIKVHIFRERDIKLLIKIITAYKIYWKSGAGKLKADDADVIIWLYYPSFYLYKHLMIWDLLLMASVAQSGKKFRVHKGADIGKYRDKTILFNVHKDRIEIFKLENYSATYQLVTKQLEEQNNKVYPTYHDVLYWENKAYMHEMFDKLNIKSPRTTLYDNFQNLMDKETFFPFLIKIPQSSGSYGQFNVVDRAYLLSIKKDPIILANKYYLAQERLNITMDMRIILVDNEIVHYYWRKNKDKSKWKTTSTSHGSTVDFNYFPEQWRENIINSFKKLNIIMGAFDLGWQNDDLSTEPYIFEVSPAYDINPKISNIEYLDNYGGWKKLLLFKGSFDRLFVEETYRIKGMGVDTFFRRIDAEK